MCIAKDESGKTPGVHRGDHLADLTRVRHARRVAQRDLLGAHLPQGGGDLHRALDGDRALVGAAEDGGDVRPHPQALGDGGADDLPQGPEALADGAVHVLEVVGL
jgi:hypothetical protein